MAEADKEYHRFTLSQRIQHIVLFISVFILAATGLPRKYYDAWWAGYLVDFFGGLDNMALLHRVAAVMMIGVGLYHVFYYILVERQVPFWRRAVIPTKKDFVDFYMHMKYILGLSDEFPKMGRYTWYEKFDYMGAFWGMVIMIFSGLIMWKFDIALQYIPLGVLEAIWVMHGEEATLAIAFLVLIHMYNAHINPEVFPMTLRWIHGKITREEMEKYHPLELEEIEKIGVKKGG